MCFAVNIVLELGVVTAGPDTRSSLGATFTTVTSTLAVTLSSYLDVKVTVYVPGEYGARSLYTTPREELEVFTAQSFGAPCGYTLSMSLYAFILYP